MSYCYLHVLVQREPACSVYELFSCYNIQKHGTAVNTYRQCHLVRRQVIAVPAFDSTNMLANRNHASGHIERGVDCALRRFLFRFLYIIFNNSLSFDHCSGSGPGLLRLRLLSALSFLLSAHCLKKRNLQKRQPR